MYHKKIVNRNDLFDFKEKLEKLKNIDDIEVLKNQLDKAINYFEEKIINIKCENINELKKVIYDLMTSDNPKNKKYYALYQEIKEKKLSIDEAAKKFIDI